MKPLPFPKNVHQLYRIPITISNHNSSALVDTGAAASFISSPLFSQLEINHIKPVDGDEVSPQFKTASGNVIAPLGYYSTPVTLGNQLTLFHPFFIVPKLEESCI